MQSPPTPKRKFNAVTVPPLEGGVTGLTLGLLEVGGVTPLLVGVLETGTLEPGGVTLLASPGKLGVFEFGALTLLALLTLERAGGVTLLGG